MAELLTLQDLADARRDAQSLEDVVNGADWKQVTTRKGETYPSIKKAMKGLFENGGLPATPFETKALMTASALTDGDYAVVVNDTASKSGLYLKKSGSWVKMFWGDLLNTNSYTINSGKDYPMQQLSRAGSTSPARTQFLDIFLDCAIYNADPNYYYLITVLDANHTGVRVEKALRSTFDGSGASTIIHNTTDTAFVIDRAKGGSQYQYFKTVGDDVYVEMIINVDKLPTIGTPVGASRPQDLGYSWVIDPVCYRESLPLQKLSDKIDEQIGTAPTSHLAINSGNNYPFEPIDRGNTNFQAVNSQLKDCVLDIEVNNARQGYYYRLTYLQNGFTGNPSAPANYGVNISRVAIDELTINREENIVSYLNPEVQVIPNRAKGGIQTFYINCPDDPITTVKLTLDVDKLPPDGTAIVSSSLASDGYNSIIMPSLYNYIDAFNFVASDIYVEYEPTDNRISFCYLSGNKWYMAICARKSVNMTFAPLGFGWADAYTRWGDLIPPQFAKYAIRAEGLSDFHSPLNFKVDVGGDNVILGTGANGSTVTVYDGASEIGSTIVDNYGKWFFFADGFAAGDTLRANVDGVTTDYTVEAAPVGYTAGSHGSDGYTAGYATAAQKDIAILIDGAAIDLTKPLKCIACKVECVNTVAVMAYNTMPSKRFALEQNYVYTLSSHGIWIDCSYRALEDVTVTADNGCQHYFAGLTPPQSNSYLFWGGKQTSRQQIPDAAFTSGTKLTNPNVFGVTTRHPLAGEYTSWIDCNYGVGNREFLNDDIGLYEFLRPTGAKIYGRLISNMPLAKGVSYKWRGGYYWGSVSDTTYHDVKHKTQAGWVLVNKNGDYAIV